MVINDKKISWLDPKINFIIGIILVFLILFIAMYIGYRKEKNKKLGNIKIRKLKLSKLDIYYKHYKENLNQLMHKWLEVEFKLSFNKIFANFLIIKTYKKHFTILIFNHNCYKKYFFSIINLDKGYQIQEIVLLKSIMPQLIFGILLGKEKDFDILKKVLNINLNKANLKLRTVDISVLFKNIKINNKNNTTDFILLTILTKIKQQQFKIDKNYNQKLLKNNLLVEKDADKYFAIYNDFYNDLQLKEFKSLVYIKEEVNSCLFCKNYHNKILSLKKSLSYLKYETISKAQEKGFLHFGCSCKQIRYISCATIIPLKLVTSKQKIVKNSN